VLSPKRARPRAAAESANTAATPLPPLQDPAPDINVTGNLESTIRVVVPESTPSVIAEIRVRGERIRGLIEQGAFDQVFVPAFEAKELALALELRTAEWPASVRVAAATGVSRLVRCAWLLDAAGDVGDRPRLLAAAGEFDAVVVALQAVVSELQ
jgi:hypothetical protein